ncbi:hypothetical protein GOBAR_DD02045 [Gossypium barbadense]|nr:hypothetical protein GOBAR_DD02045 [Gossypium barbadense]
MSNNVFHRVENKCMMQNGLVVSSKARMQIQTLDVARGYVEKGWGLGQVSVSMALGGDRNTRYFHARATGRLKKNNIDKLKDLNGTWVTNNKDICNVAENYFNRLFRSNIQSVNNHEMDYMQECVTKETNEWLVMD